MQWCKLGRAVFRCRSVVVRSDGIVVSAKVRSPEVAHYLEGLRPSQWSAGQAVRLTWSGKTTLARVREVEATTMSTRGALVKITLERQEGGQDAMAEISTSANGRSYGPADITEVWLRSALFGEPNPLGLMSGLVPSSDPLRPLRKQPLPEDSLRAICEVLLTENLVGSGRASRITNLRLGVPIAGKRRLTLRWVESQRYTNVEPGARSIDGRINL